MVNSFDNKQNTLYKFDQIFDADYNLQESPSTSTYHQIAAHDNPDYAQAIGDIYRWGDVNRAKFKTDLDMLSGLNKREYLQQVQQEQRDYAKQLRDEQRAYNEKQQARAWARADAKAKELRDQQLEDQRFQVALKLFDKQQEDPRNIANYTPYQTKNTNINLDMNQLAQERQDLIDAGNNLFTPENLVGNTPNEILYNALLAEKQHQQAVQDYNKKAQDIRSNYQEDLLQNAAEQSYLTGKNNMMFFNRNRASNVLSNQDNRSYAAKLISSDPFLGLTHQDKYAKAQMLQDFMYNYNAVDAGGWNTDNFTKALGNKLTESGYNIADMAPLFGYDDEGNPVEYIYDNVDATIYKMSKYKNEEVLIPVQTLEDRHTNTLGKLFLYLTKANKPIKTERPENFGE